MPKYFSKYIKTKINKCSFLHTDGVLSLFLRSLAKMYFAILGPDAYLYINRFCLFLLKLIKQNAGSEKKTYLGGTKAIITQP